MVGRSPVRYSGRLQALTLGLPASLAVPCLPDPPRCNVDLQRLTAVTSRLSWLPGSACALLPFGLDPGVFATAAAAVIAHGGLSPLVALRAPSRTATSASSVPSIRCTTTGCPSRPAPWGFSAPPTLPVRGIRVPARPSALRIAPKRFVALPRRGLPHPRRPPPSFSATLTA